MIVSEPCFVNRFAKASSIAFMHSAVHIEAAKAGAALDTATAGTLQAAPFIRARRVEVCGAMLMRRPYGRRLDMLNAESGSSDIRWG